MRVIVHYALSPNGQKAALKGNLNAEPSGTIVLDDPDCLTLDWVDVDDEGHAHIDLFEPLIDTGCYEPYIVRPGDCPDRQPLSPLDAPPSTLDDVLQILQGYAAALEDLEGQLPQMIAEKAAKRERQEAEAAQRAEERAEERRRAQAEQEAAAAAAAARDAEKSEWIAAHGSDYLRTAHQAGYDCQRQYVSERAALDLPGFAVMPSQAGWSERSCPSEQALQEALRVGGRVIWAEPGFEAILVARYLGGTLNLVRPV